MKLSAVFTPLTHTPSHPYGHSDTPTEMHTLRITLILYMRHTKVTPPHRQANLAIKCLEEKPFSVEEYLTSRGGSPVDWIIHSAQSVEGKASGSHLTIYSVSAKRGLLLMRLFFRIPRMRYTCYVVLQKFRMSLLILYRLQQLDILMKEKGREGLCERGQSLTLESAQVQAGVCPRQPLQDVLLLP